MPMIMSAMQFEVESILNWLVQVKVKVRPYLISNGVYRNQVTQILS